MPLSDFDAVRLISGAVVDKKRGIAFCHCDTHRGYLTKENVTKHKCLKKSCTFFQKVDLEYWENRDRQKATAKSERKLGLHNAKLEKNAVEQRNARIKELLEQDERVTVTAILEEQSKPLRICFLSPHFMDFSKQREEIRKLTEKPIYFKWVR